MNMSKHSAAPWTYDEESGLILASGNVGANDREVATVHPTLAYGADNANARLIAAAPDLLAALCQIAGGCTPGFNYSYTKAKVAAIARAAIAKATS